ncbi:MAG: endonuclease/exonuclease/phosphatase family protein [Bdellovibrionota bacterium]
MWKYLLLLLLVPQFSIAEELKIMTWNTYMLPKPIKSSHQKQRSHAIADLLKKSDYDLVFLQEAFSPFFRRTLKHALKTKYPYYKRLKKKFGLYPIMGPGLIAYSKFPMEQIDHVYYNKCSKADCHASKGVQLLEVTLPSGKRIQVANTHMQSGSDQKEAGIRSHQLDQVRKLLKDNNKSAVPQILVGDLNINSYKGTEFENTLAMLQMNQIMNDVVEQTEPEETSVETKPVIERIRDFFSAGFAVTCLKEGNESSPKLLDHVLYLEHDQKITFKDDQIIFPEFELKGKMCPLSDHRPRVVTLEI